MLYFVYKHEQRICYIEQNDNLSESTLSWLLILGMADVPWPWEARKSSWIISLVLRTKSVSFEGYSLVFWGWKLPPKPWSITAQWEVSTRISPLIKTMSFTTEINTRNPDSTPFNSALGLVKELFPDADEMVRFILNDFLINVFKSPF